MNDPRKLSAEELKVAHQDRRGVYPIELSADAMREAGFIEYVMLMPLDFNERVQYLGNMLAQMAPNSVKDDRLRFVAGRLCASLSYLLNSASFREGQLHDFDLREIQSRLGRLGGGS